MLIFSRRPSPLIFLGCELLLFVEVILVFDYPLCRKEKRIDNPNVFRRQSLSIPFNKNMKIIKYLSTFFNITNTVEYINSVKSVNISKQLCGNCPFRKHCSNPKAIFYGYYDHPVFTIVEETSTELVTTMHYGKKRTRRKTKTKKTLKKINITIQRIMGKGCGKTFSLVPSFHLPYHPFLINDAKDIISNFKSCTSDFFDFNDASLMRAIIRLYNNIDTDILTLEY